MVITWTRGEERSASQDYKRGLRTLGPPRQFFSDLTKYALTILVTDPGRGSNIMPGDRGRSCLDPAEGDEFLSVTGQQ